MTPHQVMLYEYVEDILERRQPHREDHLALVARWKQDGRLVLAGALGDPPHGAIFVFPGEDASVAEQFASADPYVAAGLVTGRRVERCNVV
jgi:uncharacterized protein YciI